MGVELEPEWQPATKLNVIAGELDFGALDPLPEGVSRDRIEEICYTLRELYGDYVDEIVAETTLSRREAQTWVLRNLAHEGTERLTCEAVGLYIWAIGRATEGDPLSRTIVTDYADRAEAKIAAAEATVKRTGPPPYPDDVYDDPALLWVEGSVGERLRARTGPDETYGEAIERLLDGTLSSVSMADLVDAYRERGADYIAVDTVYPDWDTELRIAVRTGADPPPAVADADAVTVDGTPYDLRVTADPDLSPARSHLVVFDASDGADAGDGGEEPRDPDGVEPAAGLDRLRTALDGVEQSLPEAVERARAAGATALAVGNQPAGAGAHLYPVFPDEREDPFAFLERLALDDRTLDVGSVSPVTGAEYDAVADETTLLWAGEESGIGRSLALPDDPAERRERFPDRVLRTAT
ncbi:hypothetical protein BRC83_03950 [Halobacteriales archaeon QS_1_68_17]|nr:MAG: hypothetical protein BRC83_03950 [Halobacteriales archaeon QS_1_68_17]